VWSWTAIVVKLSARNPVALSWQKLPPKTHNQFRVVKNTSNNDNKGAIAATRKFTKKKCRGKHSVFSAAVEYLTVLSFS